MNYYMDMFIAEKYYDDMEISYYEVLDILKRHYNDDIVSLFDERIKPEDKDGEFDLDYWVWKAFGEGRNNYVTIRHSMYHLRPVFMISKVPLVITTAVRSAEL